jgi:hypothetical protein
MKTVSCPDPAILDSKSFAILESKSFAILLNLLSRIPKIANCFVLLSYQSVAIPHFAWEKIEKQTYIFISLSNVHTSQ